MLVARGIEDRKKNSIMSLTRPVTSVQASNRGDSLDLFSISQTSELASVTYAPKNRLDKCVNNAPFFAWQSTEYGWQIAQGCCNDWSCPKCGIKRAKAEYGRIVEGCRELAKENELYFITLTCRGRDMSLEEAEKNYLTWTNKVLTAMRTRAKRSDEAWHYVQVTERQKRGHPHSHILTTYKPHDLYIGTVEKWSMVNGQRVKELVPALRSDWLQERVISAGLGNQYDISQVESVEGASRYVAKYMFKPTMFTDEWSKNWRRVRYSQSFPKLPNVKTDAIALIKPEHWLGLAEHAIVVNPRDEASLEECHAMLWGHDVLIRPLKSEQEN